LNIAFELANKKWKLGFSDGVRDKILIRNMDAGSPAQLDRLIDQAKQYFLLPDDVEIISCYEAGRDGFWLHRHLESIGVRNMVIDPSSIEVPRRKRRAKTDKLDVRKMLALLVRHNGGERRVFSIVRVPDRETEDLRRINRELDRLRRERTMHTNRIGSLLVMHNIRAVKVTAKFSEQLDRLTDYEGRPLSPNLKAELAREFERWRLVHQQILELAKYRRQQVEREDLPLMEKVRALAAIRGIGYELAWLFVVELFGWREFRNRKEVGAFVGLVGMPYSSGEIERDQGISKSGSRVLRSKAVQMAWLWLYYQPESKQAKWFKRRFAEGGRRMRKVGIVAVARRLLVELWQYLEFGAIADGVVIA
jgi:transposase